ncbi:hypothetical protein FOL47_002035 [Perkinsus chesapeaki]|uniref:Rad21/Rec8-like protein N-terminal domain-containing protein n=1 Tax=Perkinsus chesapeaki TaxID=330153 RepID=A0A7J6MG84_PERCH|nr:hypothetical protein FOL47_002035 [Perkinsus chesapeaki]
MSPSSVAAASDTTTASVAKDVPSLQKDFTEFWIAATRVVRLKRGQIDIDIAEKVSELMRAIVSANGRLGDVGHPGRKDKHDQVSLRVYGLLVKGVCVLFSRKADLILKRCDNVMAKFRETLRSTKGITGEDGSDGDAAAGAKRKRKQRKRKEQPADDEEEEVEERNARRHRVGSDHPTSVTDSVPTRLADATPPSEGSHDEGRRRNAEGLVESGEVVGNSQLPMLTSAELRELSLSNASDRVDPPSMAGDAPPPLDELMTPSAHGDAPPPSVGSPVSAGPGVPLPSSRGSSVPPVRRARAKRRASSGVQRRPKRTRLDRQVHINQAEYDQWVANDELIARTREMQWRPADYIRASPASTRLDFLGPDLTKSIEEGSFPVGLWGGGQGQQPPMTPNDDMEVDELRDQLGATELEEAFMEPPTPLDSTMLNGGRQERVSLLSDVFARTPQTPSEPATPHSQEVSSLNTANQAAGKFPPTHLSMETLRASIDPNTQYDQRGGLKGFDSHTFAFKNLIRNTVARQEGAGEVENPKAVGFSTLAPSGLDGASRYLAVKSLYHTLLLAAHGEIDVKQPSPFGAITLTMRDPTEATIS